MKRKTIQPETESLILDLLNAWRRFMKLAGPDDRLQTREFRTTCANVKKIEEALKKTPEADFYTREIIASYLLYHFPLHYQQAFSLISELPTPPKRVLEVGCGLAPFAFAALKLGAEEAFGLDMNDDALRLGAEFIGRQGYPITLRKYRYPSDRFPIEGEFDLIMLPYCLAEFGNEEKLIEQCFNRLTSNGHLMIVDTTEPERNRHILRLRDHYVKQGVPIQAPCVWQGGCSALEAKSMCFAQREYEKPYLMKEIQRGAEIFLNSLKMTYVIFKKPKSVWPEVPVDPAYRIVSPPIDGHRGKYYYLCGTTGSETLDIAPDVRYTISRGSLVDKDGTVIRAPGKPL